MVRFVMLFSGKKILSGVTIVKYYTNEIGYI
jgi:hypothetical protein